MRLFIGFFGRISMHYAAWVQRCEDIRVDLNNDRFDPFTCRLLCALYTGAFKERESTSSFGLIPSVRIFATSSSCIVCTRVECLLF